MLATGCEVSAHETQTAFACVLGKLHEANPEWEFRQRILQNHIMSTAFCHGGQRISEAAWAAMLEHAAYTGQYIFG